LTPLRFLQFSPFNSKNLEDHMKLLTAELRANLPPLYAQEKNTDPVELPSFSRRTPSGPGM
jgi:hypothetical protein